MTLVFLSPWDSSIFSYKDLSSSVVTNQEINTKNITITFPFVKETNTEVDPVNSAMNFFHALVSETIISNSAGSKNLTVTSCLEA